MSVDTIKTALRELNKNNEEIYSIVCSVDSVDLANKTCDCSPKDGKADLLGVRLMAKNTTGFFIIPTIGSDVVVTMINRNTGYVSMFSDVDFIHLNGDVYGGLMKINEFTLKQNQLVVELQAQLALISTAIAGVGGSYVAGVLSAFNKSDYENTKVKQGNG